MSLYLPTLCVLSFCSTSHLSFSVYAVHFLSKSLPFPLSGEKHILSWHWSKLNNEEHDYNWWRIWIHLSSSQIIYYDSESQIPFIQGFLSEAAATVTIYCWYAWNLGLGGNWGQAFEALSKFPKAKSFKISHVGLLKLGICQFLILFKFLMIVMINVTIVSNTYTLSINLRFFPNDVSQMGHQSWS